nr:hypothetical protein CFP56_55928 [Quercus suber]
MHRHWPQHASDDKTRRQGLHATAVHPGRLKNIGVRCAQLMARLRATVPEPCKEAVVAVSRNSMATFDTDAELGQSSQLSRLLEDDYVYPVHMLDDLAAHRSIVMGWTLRFNDVLNADQLHNALTKLLEIGD